MTNITYVNRTTGVTAIRHEDFAAGRPVARAAVHIDPQQMAHVQVMARPEVTPTAQAKISAPPVRRVPVAVARPVMINAKGMAVAAQPKARPLPPPVKTAPPPPRLPNRTVVAPPPNVKMTPTARQAMQTAPASHPGQPPAPAAQQPAANRPVQPPVPAHPAGTTPPASGERPGQLPRKPAEASSHPCPGSQASGAAAALAACSINRETSAGADSGAPASAATTAAPDATGPARAASSHAPAHPACPVNRETSAASSGTSAAAASPSCGTDNA